MKGITLDDIKNTPIDPSVIRSAPSHSEAKREQLYSNIQTSPVAEMGNYIPNAAADSKYLKNIPYEQLVEGNLEEWKFQQQGFGDALVNSLNQAIVGEIVGGTIEGIGYLLDIPQYANIIAGTEKEFGNWFSDIGKGLKTWTKEATPIYTDPARQGKFDPGHWSWWLSNFPSVASTLSLMIPATGAVKGMSMLGKAMGIGKELGATAKFAVTGISQAIVSRHMENLMESSQVYEEAKQKGYTDEQAAKGAAASYKRNWAALAFDIPQYLMLNKVKLKNGKYGIAENVEKPSIAVEAARKKLGLSNALGTAQRERYVDILQTMGEEGLEEFYQYVVGEQAGKIADKAAGKQVDTSFGAAVDKALKSGEAYTSAFFGALGGGVMQVAGKPINDAIMKAKGIKTEEQAQIEELKVTANKVSELGKLFETAKEFGNPYMADRAAGELIFDLAYRTMQKGETSMADLKAMIENDEALDPETKKDVYAKIERIEAIDSEVKQMGNLHKAIDAKITKSIFTVEDLNKRNSKLEQEKRKIENDRTLKNKLTSTGSELFDLEVQMASAKDRIKYFTKSLEMGLYEEEQIPEIQEQIKKEQQHLKSFENRVQAINKDDARTPEEKISDKDILDSTGFRDIIKIENQLRTNEFEINAHNKNIKFFSDKKNQQDWINKKTNTVKEETANEIKTKVEKATTEEELKTIEEEINGEPLHVPEKYVGQSVSYNGKTGILIKDGDHYSVETTNNIYELPDLTDGKELSSFGITPINKLGTYDKYDVSNISDNEVTVNGVVYTINTDSNGNVESLSPKNKPEQQIRNEKLIIAVEIQRNKLETNLFKNSRNLDEVYEEEVDNNKHLKTIETIFSFNTTPALLEALDLLYENKELTPYQVLIIDVWLKDAQSKLERLSKEYPTIEEYKNALDNLELIDLDLFINDYNRQNGKEQTITGFGTQVPSKKRVRESKKEARKTKTETVINNADESKEVKTVFKESVENKGKKESKEAVPVVAETSYTRYKGKPILFKKEKEELNNLINESTKISDQIKKLFANNIDTAEKYEEFIKLNFGQGRENLGAEINTLLDILDNYFKDKSAEFAEDIKNKGESEESTGLIKNNTTTKDVEEDTDTLVEAVPNVGIGENEIGFKVDKFEREFNQETKKLTNVYKRDKQGNLIPTFEMFDPIDYDFLDSTQMPNNGEVTFEVPAKALDEANYRDRSKIIGGKLQPLLNYMEISVVYYDTNGNRHVVGKVPSIKSDSKTLQLRTHIYEQVKEGKEVLNKTTISMPISKKMRASLWTIPTQQAPNKILADGEKLWFAVGTEVNGEVSLEVGDVPSNVTIVDKKDRVYHNGGVYVLLKTPDGRYLPVLTYTVSLKESPKDMQEVLRLFDALDDQNWVNTRKALQKIAYMDFYYNAGKLTFYKKGEEDKSEAVITFIKDENNEYSGTLKTDPSKRITLQEYISNFNLQVSHKDMNNATPGYNESVAYRVKVNVNPQQNFHSSGIIVPLYDPKIHLKGEIPKPDIKPTEESPFLSDEELIAAGIDVVSSTELQTKKDDIDRRWREDLEIGKLLNNDFIEAVNKPKRRDTKQAVKDLINYLKTSLKWDKVSIGYNNNIFSFTVNNIDFNVSGSGSILGGGLLFLDINLNDIINAKYNAELVALESTKPSIEITDTLDDTPTTKKQPKTKIYNIKLGGATPTKTDYSGELNDKFLVTAENEKDFETWNEAEETVWFKDRFGELVPLNTNQKEVEALQKKLRSVGELNGVFHGVFHNAMVYIQNSAMKGTVYHEAFHTVFNLFLNTNQRKAIFKEAEQLYKTSDKKILEEKLAEAFKEYVFTEKEEKRGLGKRILDFFNSLYLSIKMNLGGNISVNQMFKRIQYGSKFKRNKVFDSTIAKFANKDFNLNRFSLEYITPKKREQRVKTVNNLLIDLVDTYINEQKALGRDVTFMEAIKEKSLDYFYIGVFNTLSHKYENDTRLNAEKKDELYYFIKEFIDVEATNEAGRVIFVKDGIGELALKELEDRGISVKTNKQVKDITDSPNDEDSLYEFSENRVYIEGWQMDVNSTSGKDRLSNVMKTALSNIKREDIPGDDLGFDVMMDGNEVFSYLKRLLSGSQDVYEMMDRLEEISEVKPSYKNFLTKLYADEKLRTLFYISFRTSHTPSFAVIETFGEMRVIDSNSTGVGTMLIDDWKIDFYDPIMNKLLTNGNIDKIKAGQAVERIKQAKELINTDTKKAARLITNEFNNIGLLAAPEDFYWLADRPYKFKTFIDKNVLVIFNALAKGKDIFAETAEGENTSIKKVTNTLAINREDLHESSHKSVENKTIYDHQIPNFTSDFIEKLHKEDFQEALDWYLDTPFYADNYWLNRMSSKSDIEVPRFRDAFKLVLLDGLKLKNAKRGTTYSDMGDLQLEATNIAMYFNNNNQSSLAYYKMPIFADSPSAAYVQFERIKDLGNPMLEAFYSIALQEQKRINNVKSRKELIKKDPSLKIKNYDDHGDRFLILSFLNNKGIDVLNDKEGTKAAINSWLTNVYAEELLKFKELGILNKVTNKKGEETYEFIDNRIERSFSNVEDFLKEYVYNNIFAQKQMQMLFSGDLAYYALDKGSKYSVAGDFNKRNKQVYSPKLPIDVDAELTLNNLQKDVNGNIIPLRVNDEYATYYLEDVEFRSSLVNEIKTVLDKLVSEGKMNTIKRASILAKYGYSNAKDKEGNDIVKVEGTSQFFKTEDINQTDAQAYITLDRYREIMVGLGRWNAAEQGLYDRLQAGEAVSDPDLDVVFQPIKPFYFGHSKVNGNIVPVQNKNAEYLLTPYIANQSPKLRKLLDFMEEQQRKTHKTVSVNFNSAVKVGGYGSIKHKDGEFDYTNATPHILSNKNYGLQQETPSHYLEEEIIAGTQSRKLGVSDLPPDSKFFINNQEYSRDELVKLYNDTISKDVSESFNKLMNELGYVYDPSVTGVNPIQRYVNTETGEITNDQKIHDLLISEVTKRRLGREMENALELDQNKMFKFPLYHPRHAKRVESLLLSLFKNNVIKQQINGASFVQVSNFGFDDNLQLKIDDKTGRVLYAECAIPITFKEGLKPYLKKNGEVDIAKIEKDMPEFLEMIGYRIPTEDKYSMMPLRIVRFLPQNTGGVIMLPAEITTIAGSDFDVDKMYVMIPNIRKEKVKPAAQRVLNILSASKKYKSEANAVFLNFELIRTIMENPKSAKLINVPEFVKDDVKNVANRTRKMTYISPTTDLETSTKEERENLKIRILWETLTNNGVFDKFINPGGFSNWKDLAADIRQYNEKTGDLDMSLPSNIRDIFNRNMTGKALIGIFANHNINHAILQYSDVVYNDIIASFNSKEYDTLSNMKSEGDYISRRIASLLAAAVDNAKDPILSDLNINTYTADTVALLLRLGLNEKTVAYFINQPVLRQLSYNYFNKGGGYKADKDAFAEMEKAILDVAPVLAKYKDLFKSLNITDDMLLKGLKNLPAQVMEDPTNKALVTSEGISQEELKKVLSDKITMQYIALTQFAEFKEHGKDLATINRAMKSDDINMGSTISDLEKYKRDIDKARTVGINIKGINEILAMQKDFLYNMVGAFQEAKFLTSNFMSLHFPWLNDGFMQIKNDLNDELGRDLTVEEMEMINYQLLGFIATQHSFFDPSKSDIINTLPTRLNELKKSESPLKDNTLIKRLFFRPADEKRNVIDRIIFSNTGSLTNYDRDSISYAWEEMLKSKDPDTRKLAEDLVLYTFFTSGFTFTPYSFAHLIPVAFFSEHLNTSEGQSFNNFVKDIFNQSKLEGIYYHFKDQFYRNNTHTQFVPFVKEEGDINIDRVEYVNDEPVRVIVDSKTNKTTSLFVRTGNLDRPTLFKPFIKIQDKKDIKLFKLVSEVDGLAVYERTNKLGIPNYVLEYFYNNNAKSIYGFNDVMSQEQPSPMAEQDDIDKFMRDNMERNVLEEKDQINKTVPIKNQKEITAKGKMTFSYGANKRNDIKATTTFEAIKNGERTATTRYESNGHIDYWKKLKVGDIIEWESSTGEKILVEVTKPLHKLISSGKTAEQWSKLEGWSVDYFNSKVKSKLNEAWQIEYKLVQPTKEFNLFTIESQSLEDLEDDKKKNDCKGSDNITITDTL